MIGYYVHHQGRGHSHRAIAIARELEEPVTGLSSLARPRGWAGEWVELERDDEGTAHHDATASQRLHWVPEGDGGLRSRMAAVSRWIEMTRPRLMVVDVSVEITVLCRLHGVPVITVALPGERGDAGHALGFDVSRAILAAWPPEMDGMIHGLSRVALRRIEAVGAIARYPVDSGDRAERGHGPGRVVVLSGTGGDGFDPALIAAARRQTPQWHWTVLGGGDEWVDDPWEIISAATVVVTHAGQNALAEVAAVRRPAIVIPQPRPHGEQTTTAAALRSSGRWPVVVHEAFPTAGWTALLSAAAALDGNGWVAWNDGGGASRAAAVIERELALRPSDDGGME